MFTQEQRYRLKLDIADILDDHGLPHYLKVSRLADLFEDRCLGRVLGLPDLDAFLDDGPPPEVLPAKKKRGRKKAAGKTTTRRKTVNSTA